MIQVIVLSTALVILLLIFNSAINSICGLDASGSHGKVLEGTLTIFALYLVIISLFGGKLAADGMPFVDQLDNYPSITFMFQDRPAVFIYECAELISLSFLISLLSSCIPGNLGGAGITGTIIRSIVLVLVGIIANNYFIALVKKTSIFSWVLTALQCFFSGTALILTPAMVIGRLLQLDPENSIVAFLIKKLPQTKIGKAMSTAASNSTLLVLAIMIFESQFGSLSSLLSQVPMVISLFAPLVIMLIGIRLVIRSVTL